ncbi:hypothetical protein KL909_001026 [Ogataea angusta]|nr:hypothetical protein KL909_001026 [Ogataea angusta]
MSLGTLYAGEATRVLAAKGVVKALGLDVKFGETTDEAFQKNFPLGKVPAFIGPKGYKLNEAIAVLYYCEYLQVRTNIDAFMMKYFHQLYSYPLVSLKDENHPLLGKTFQDRAQVLKWISFASSEFMVEATTAFKPFVGKAPYNKKAVDEALEKMEKCVSALEARLEHYTYLVGERLTIADVFVASMFYRPFTVLYGDEWRSKHPYLTRWWKTIAATDFLNWFFKDVKLIEKPLEAPKPAKKEKAPKADKAPKAEAAPKAAAEKPAEEPAQEKKPKHPLEALGKPTIPLDEWKRKYSNEDTRAVALPYFWNEFFNPDEWSLWKVAYKYNDELTLTFMSNNLVGGFFNRLSASTKYMFGSAVVYGENNNNGIIGAFLVRGQDAVPAFEVAPDWESYEITKLDPSKPEDRDFVDNMWAWDKPVNGQEIVDGKVFK